MHQLYIEIVKEDTSEDVDDATATTATCSNTILKMRDII